MKLNFDTCDNLCYNQIFVWKSNKVLLFQSEFNQIKFKVFKLK